MTGTCRIRVRPVAWATDSAYRRASAVRQSDNSRIALNPVPAQEVVKEIVDGGGSAVPAQAVPGQ